MAAEHMCVLVIWVACLVTLTQGQAAVDSQLETRVALLEKQGADQGKLIAVLLDRLDTQDGQLKAQTQTIQRQNLSLERQDEQLQVQSLTLEETHLLLRQHAEDSDKLKSIVRHQESRIHGQQRALRTLQFTFNHKEVHKSNVNTDNDSADETVASTNNLSNVNRRNIEAARGKTQFTTSRQANSFPESVQTKRLLLNTEGPVAFHAVIDQSEVAHIGQNQNIVFGVVLENLGGGYHKQHGIFIAPVNGVYLFSVSIMSYVNAHPEVQVDLKKDGVTLAKAFAHGDNGRHDQGSVTVVTNLTQGNEVWISLEYPNDDSILGQRFSSFTGCLLYQM